MTLAKLFTEYLWHVLALGAVAFDFFNVPDVPCAPDDEQMK